MLRPRWLFFVAPVFLGLLLLSACEESVNPIVESDRNFSLFATLDMDQDTQFVRVIPIREALQPDPSAALDVTFTSEDLDTGERVAWRDSLIAFDDGSIGHFFYAPLRLRAGHTYRVEVQSPDEPVVTSAVTTVPAAPAPTIFPEVLSGGVGGAIARGSQQITWQGVFRQPFLLEQWYRFLLAENAPFIDVRVPYEPPNVLDNGVLDVTLNLQRDRLTLDSLINTDTFPLLGMGMKLTILDSAFEPPGDRFDREVLVQPGTFSNVENGFGFVGSVGRFSVEWVLPDESVRLLRYQTLEDVFGDRAAAIRARLQREAVTSHALPGHHSGVQ